MAKILGYYRPVGGIGGGPVSGFGDAVSDMLDQYASQFAQTAYTQVKSDFEADADQWVGAMKPYLQDAVKEMIADADTQAALATAKRDLMIAFAVSAVGTAALTYAMIKLL